MFSRPKILFLVSLLFVALLNPKFNPYLPFKFLIFYNMLLLQIPSTGLGRSMYILPKCLTGCWLEATQTATR